MLKLELRKTSDIFYPLTSATRIFFLLCSFGSFCSKWRCFSLNRPLGWRPFSSPPRKKAEFKPLKGNSLSKGEVFYCSTVTPLDIQQILITFKHNLMQFAGQSTAGSAVSPRRKVFLSWFIQEKAAQHPIHCSNVRGSGNEKIYRGPEQWPCIPRKCLCHEIRKFLKCHKRKNIAKDILSALSYSSEMLIFLIWLLKSISTQKFFSSFKSYFMSEFFIKLFICIASIKTYTQKSAKNLATCIFT